MSKIYISELPRFLPVIEFHLGVFRQEYEMIIELSATNRAMFELLEPLVEKHDARAKKMFGVNKLWHAAVLAHLYNGDKIQAIEVVRYRDRLSLKQAQDLIYNFAYFLQEEKLINQVINFMPPHVPFDYVKVFESMKESANAVR